MIQNNVEQKKTPVKWIVPLPEKEGGTFGRPSLCAACRGNEDIGVVLNYFTFESSVEVKNRKIDTSKVQFIPLKRTHDEILAGIKPSRISKKTLIGYIRKLQEWGFIKANGYHHTYEVYFLKIAEAIQNPPIPERRKPRGRHVSKLQSQKLNLQSDTVKTTIPTELKVKSTIHEDEAVLKLQSEMFTLQSQIVNLQSEMFTLQSQIVTLQSVQSYEVAPQQGADGKNDALRLIRDCNRLLKNISSNMSVANHVKVFSLLTEDDYQTIDELMTVTSVANATPSPLIENLYQSLGETQPADSASPITTQPEHTPPFDARPTPAGGNTIADEEKEPRFPDSSTLPEQTEVNFLDTAILEPPCNATMPLTQESATIPQSENTTPESLPQAQEMPSSTQAVGESNRQATEQSQQQANGDDPIATGTTKNPPATNNTAPQKPRSRGKGASGKEEKLPLSDEEKAKEAQYTERRRFWQNKINERRGGPLRRTGLCINETECLNILVREFDDIDIGKIDRHLATEHWKYKKNPAEIGGKALLDESRPTLQYLKTHGNQSSNGSSQQTPTPIKGSMTHDEACKLAQDAIEEAEQYNITITAQAFSSKNNPDIWGVRVKWDDGSKDGFPFPVIKVREQWDGTLTEIRKIIKEEAKQAARSVARMQEAK